MFITIIVNQGTWFYEYYGQMNSNAMSTLKLAVQVEVSEPYLEGPVHLFGPFAVTIDGAVPTRHFYSVLRLFAIKQNYSLISSLSRPTPLGYLIKELQTLVLP
ncbi:hypothetical protein ALC57_18667 [Trachymyrmex cornetzi]|uniref:Uncharacterized protein n=1 Tax=Trachymyrmex cornetzi TaxID=471704 RepID=A0A195D8P3_9HYME|nr:hypothetical protein ALC57_18667 [Trachymyrmex cornetzi]